LLGFLNLQRLPPFNQLQPKCLVAGIASNSGKATAFIGSSPELFYTHDFPPFRPAGFFSGSEL
jgi:hypothetical protein